MNCSECEKINSRRGIVYEDELSIALLSETPAVAGHIILLPKAHHTIIEQVPEATASHLFSVANKLSVACFEVLGAHGTNILIKNGVSAGQKSNHASINIIPRKEDDGLNLQWNTIKETEDNLKTSQLSLQSELEKTEEKKEEVKEVKPNLGKAELGPDEQVHLGEEPKEEIPDDENYMIRQLERIP